MITINEGLVKYIRRYWPDIVNALCTPVLVAFGYGAYNALYSFLLIESVLWYSRGQLASMGIILFMSIMEFWREATLSNIGKAWDICGAWAILCIVAMIIVVMRRDKEMTKISLGWKLPMYLTYVLLSISFASVSMEGDILYSAYALCPYMMIVMYMVKIIDVLVVFEIQGLLAIVISRLYMEPGKIRDGVTAVHFVLVLAVIYSYYKIRKVR